MARSPLSAKGRDILKVIQLQADAPFRFMRKALGVRDHAIAYHVGRAMEIGLARRRCFLNLSRLGLHYYEVCLALAATDKKVRTTLVRQLCSSPRISWLGRLGGDFHYAFTMVGTSSSEVQDFLFELFSAFKGIFFEKALALRVSFSFFGNKYLSRKPSLREVLTYSPAAASLTIDAVDRRILKALTETGETSAPALARQIGIPPSTAAYRIRRLTQEGVIVGHYLELQAPRLGQQSLLLLMCTKGFSREFRDALYRYCLAAPRVTMFAQSIGAWDFEIGVDIEEPGHITAVLDDLYDQFGQYLNWIKVLPMFEHLKVLEYPINT